MDKSKSKYFNTACLMDEALLYLLEKKDFEYITVKEICKKAGVNRSTFYLHYESTDDLLEEAISLLNQRFLACFLDLSLTENDIREAPAESLIFLKEEYLTPYLTFVKDNKRAYKVVHKKPHLFHVDKVFKEMHGKFFAPIMQKFINSPNEAAYIFEFFTKGTLAVIMKWVEDDCRDDVQSIIQLIVRCAKINPNASAE